jgi:hypothetical protein
MKIIVESEEIKQKLIKESEYIHDFVVRCYLKRKGAQRCICLDSDKAGIFMHIYTNPDIIEVQNPENKV